MYVPSLFSFATSKEQTKAEKSLQRYEAKLRNERKKQGEEKRRNEESEYPPNTVFCDTQTDLTSFDIASLEADY